MRGRQKEHGVRTGALWSSLRRFGADRKGVAAVEFAVILPVFLILLVGMIELTTVLSVDRKVGRIGSSVADLIARETEVNSAMMNDLFSASEQIMTPYDATGTVIESGVVEFEKKSGNTFTTEVLWSAGKVLGNTGTTEPWSKGSPPPKGINIPNTIKTDGACLVITQVTHVYKPILGEVMDTLLGIGTITLEDLYFSEPRQTNCIQYR